MKWSQSVVVALVLLAAAPLDAAKAVRKAPKTQRHFAEPINLNAKLQVHTLPSSTPQG